MVECLGRMETEGLRALELLCEAHPEHADELRRRIQKLLAVGMLGKEGRPTSGSGPPEVIGPYRILRPIGRGGMGVVYLAEHEGQGTRVALKLVLSDLTGTSSSARRRFDREIQAIERLSSPHVVRLLDHGEHAGQPFLAMEYVAGISLDDAIKGLGGGAPDRLQGRDLLALVAERKEPPPDLPAFFDRSWPAVILDLMAQVAEATVHAHACGVVHRDLKPANVMLTRSGQVKVLDFGLAVLTGTTRFTSTGIPVGSLPYLAPEQIKGRPQDIAPTTDVYALGVMMYELLTLRLPYWSDSAAQTMEQILRGSPPRPRHWNPALSQAAERICLKAMDLDPRHRYPGAQGLLEDLQRLNQGRTITARAPALPRRLRRWCRLHPRLSGTAAAVLLTGASVVAWSIERDRNEVNRSLVRDQATARREQAHETAGRLLDMSRSLLAEVPGRAQEARLESIVAAVDLLEPVVREEPDEPDNRRTWGRLHRALGNLLLDVGRNDEAKTAFLTAEEALRGCVAEDPTDCVARADLAAALHGRTLCALGAGEFADALQAIEECLGHFDEAVRQEPDEVAWIASRLASQGTRLRTLRISGQAAGVDLLRRAVDEGRAARPRLRESKVLRNAYLTTMVSVALTHVDERQIPVAAELVQEVLQAMEEMPDAAGERSVRETRALCADIQARAAEAPGAGTDCGDHHDRAIELGRSLIQDFPGNLLNRSNLAAHLNARGICRMGQGHPDGPADLEEALALLDQVLRDHPDQHRIRDLHTYASVNLARARLDLHPEEALRRSLQGLAAFADGLAALEEDRRGSAVVLVQTASIAYARLGRLEEGFEFLEEHGDQAAGDHPWHTRLVADGWNEWCLAFGRAADRALELEAEQAEEHLFEYLRRAVEAGYQDRQELLTTPELEQFRQDERFAEVLAALDG